MTNEEKNNITYGHTLSTNGCAGNTGSVPRIGFPGLCLHDNQNGIRSAGYGERIPRGRTASRVRPETGTSRMTAAGRLGPNFVERASTLR